MGLKVFNIDNAYLTKSIGHSHIRISAKSGIVISQAAVISIGLTKGDKISIAQDEDDPRKWYLYKDELKGFTLRDSGKKCGSLVFNSSEIWRAASSIYKDINHSVKGVFIQPETIEGQLYHPFILPKAE